VSLPPKWGALVPGQQHSFVGGVILSQEFESLVKVGGDGIVTPSVARSWKTSADQKSIIFEIDTTKRFSDGSFVLASDIKRNWEASMRLASQSTNHSMQDLMYKIVGYEEFDRTSELAGIRAINDKTLEVRFKEPFRMAIEHFSGVRYSVAKPLRSGRFIGSGPFVIESSSSDRVKLVRNPFHPDSQMNPKEIAIVGESEVSPIVPLLNRDLDLVQLSPFSSFPMLDDNRDKLEIFQGQVSTHLILVLNGMSGRFFQDPKLRKAFQYLIHNEISENKEFLNKMAPGFEPDSQSYLPVQSGRLDSLLARELVDSGRADLERLVEWSQKNPLQIYIGSSGSWLVELLEKYGIAFRDISNSGNGWSMFFKTYEPDVFLYGFSVLKGDPDALYHTLGPNGSISTEMASRPSVLKLLEEGREITDLSKLNEHYQKVSSSILEEVPYVHLGFLRRVYVFRKNSIKLKKDILTRRDYDLSNFIYLKNK